MTNSETDKLKSDEDKIEDQIAKIIDDEIKFNAEKEKLNDDKSVIIMIINNFGIISKILFQIGEFYVCIVILNIIFESVIIYLTSTISTNSFLLKIFHYIFSISLGYFSIYPLTLVFWEFVNFNWISELNPFQTLLNLPTIYSVLGENLEQKKKMCDEFFFSLGNILFSLYLVLIILFSFINNYCYEVILFYEIIFLNVIKYSIIFAIYLIHCGVFIFNIYIVDFINFILQYLRKIKFCEQNLCEKISECSNIINKKYKVNDPFILSILYSIYITLNIKEKKEIEKKKQFNSFFIYRIFLTNPAFLFFQYKKDPNTLKDILKIFKIIDIDKKNIYTPIIIFKIILITLMMIYSIFIKAYGIFFIIICFLTFPIKISPWSHHIFYQSCCQKKKIQIMMKIYMN